MAPDNKGQPGEVDFPEGIGHDRGMSRRNFLKTTAIAAGGLVGAGTLAAGLTKRKEMLAMAETETGTTGGEAGVTIPGIYPSSIVEMADGSLMTEGGQQSTDRGRTWQKSDTFQPGGLSAAGSMTGSLGLLRLANGDLGTYYCDVWTNETALGNKTNNWFFRWSDDEGQSWSEPSKITLDGLTMGLGGTMFALRDGRLAVATYSQFLGSRFDKRGCSWGTYKGVRFQTETEGHFPLAEVARVYYSDDNGRQWQACDGWIMGWRDEKWSDAFTEPSGVELKDGRVMLMGRALTGRLYKAISDDRGHSRWPGAQPTALMASYSPCRVGRIPSTGDLLIIWNQLSREETRKGFRRARLSCAISKDDGQTWEHFKNIEAIESLAGVSYIPPDPDLTLVWGDDEVGELPEDYGNFHYPRLAFVGDEAFVSYAAGRCTLATDDQGKPTVQYTGGSKLRILPVSWFYQ